MQEKELISKPYRIAFLGRGELGYRILRFLLHHPEIEVPVIFTCRHTPEAGGKEEFFSSTAEKHQIPFYKTNNINRSQWINILNDCQIDLAVAISWVNTIQADIIKTSQNGFLNLHGGLLPRYRGNATNAWAILNGEKQMGVTAHLMDPGKLDSGPIILQETVPLTETTTQQELTNAITDLGERLIIDSIELLRSGNAEPKKQNDHFALYCYPRLPRDGEIDWHASAQQILTLIRAAGHPYPGAYSFFADIRDHNKIKKMIIRKATIEDHPTQFCAVPGHLLRVNQGKEWAVICGDAKLLLLHRIEIDGIPVKPHEYFRTVRQRFGLDTETILNVIQQQKEDIIGSSSGAIRITKSQP